MSNDIEVSLTERACGRYDFHRFLDGETSCFSLWEQVTKWLLENNVSYRLEDSIYYRDNISLHEECQSFQDVLDMCKPKIIFTDKNQAMLFKLTWG
jgi:hypothetical protein